MITVHWRRMTPLCSIFIVLVISRVMLTTLGSMIRLRLLPFVENWQLPGPISSHVWLNVWGLWDTGWYLRLATTWYSPEVPLGFAFFPAYPGLVRLIGFITDHHFLIGLLISNVALVASCWLLYKLTSQQSSPPAGRMAVWFLLAFPAAFVLSGMFTESLFLALSLGAFFAAKKQYWILAGILGLLLSLTRVIGALIIIPLAVEYLNQKQWQWKKIRADVFWLGLIVLGPVAWLWFNYQATGDAMTFIRVQEAWHRGATNPLSAIWRGLSADNFYDQALALSAIATASLLIIMRKAIPLSMKIWAWISLTTPLFSGIYSMPRYILVIFPLYIGAACMPWSRRWQWVAIFVLGAIQLGLFIYWPKPNSWVV